MERKLKWRTFWLGVAIVLAVLSLLPTFVSSDQLPPWYTKIFSQKIQKDLDLQGGFHFTYGIDLDKAIDDKATEVKRDLDAKLEDLKIAGTVSTPATTVGAVTITVDDPANLTRIDSAFLSDYNNVLVKRTCPESETSARSVCLRVSSDYGEGIKKSAIEHAVVTIRERMTEIGIAEPNVVAKEDDIVVAIPGLGKESKERLKSVMERAAKLEFKIVDENSEFMKKLYFKVEADPKAKELGITVGQDDWVHDETGKRFFDYYLKAENRTMVIPEKEAKERQCEIKNEEPDGRVTAECSGRVIMQEYLASLVAADPANKIDDNHQFSFEFVERASNNPEERQKPYWRSYFLHRGVELAGSAVSNAGVFFDQQTNRPEVSVEFNRWGGRRFGELTGENVGKKMAIILDDKIASAPTIQGKLDSGRCSITLGGGDPNQQLRDAQDLVNVLRTGSLPAPLRVEQEHEVGPMLGSDAIAKTQWAFLLGAIGVVLIMLYFYRFSGVLAIVAVALNVLFMLGILAAFGGYLSLPGIAAIVLTIGMAVDANIIIYERVREELRLGKSVRGSVDAGFGRAFAAILDGNLTTAAAGFVLYEFGSDALKSFAVMLLIGIATTLFTATWCSRLLFDHYLAKQSDSISI